MVEAWGLKAEVRFVGRVPPDQGPPYYLLADASVDPVCDDLAGRARSPLKVVESLVSGTPVVTSDVGDRRELLGDPPAGLLAAPGDAQSLAAAIDKVLWNPGLADTLKRRGQERVQLFDWERLVKDFVRVYQDA